MTNAAAGPRRGRWPLRRVHKWMSVGVGLVVLAWLVSGLVMVSPGGQVRTGAAPRVNFDSMTISPAQAAHAAMAGHEGAAVEFVNLRRLGDRLVFTVGVRGAPPALVDAGTGAIVTVTQDLAIAIAREGLPSDVALVSAERFETPPSGYDGSGPTWRVTLSGGLVAWVNARTGDVVRKNAGTRFHEFWGSVHTFRPLRQMGSRSIQMTALWVTSLVGIAVALTGYWMALPKRARKGS